MIKKLSRTLVIVGPTASGKTNLSETLAQELSGEIINADVGQFYRPLTIGTAKPNWESYPYKTHLFDCVDQPRDINIMEYRRQATDAMSKATARKHTPIIVGGSLFYLKSLFFPAHDLPEQKNNHFHCEEAVSQEYSWNQLYHIDPERALAIHPNDTYRINRALTIWKTTGVKPSAYKPVFDPALQPLFISLEPHIDVINQRIDLRTQIMLDQGWINEARTLIETPWEGFLERKQLIGYWEIFQWIRRGEKKSEYAELVKTIQAQTRQYAKRQRTFWRGLIRQLQSEQSQTNQNFSYHVISLTEQPSDADIIMIKKLWSCF
ncbi:tRNA (adenosine(37)-N6)-dimethylallyltransferase MiaA [Candidatus Dependentiae bacterium]|nr:tRNA (adenosine(37)-N6)-dimethylallyltransferase MiaA [Candidatus Dependentiae bacterium]